MGLFILKQMNADIKDMRTYLSGYFLLTYCYFNVHILVNSPVWLKQRNIKNDYVVVVDNDDACVLHKNIFYFILFKKSHSELSRCWVQ